jgi:cell filamentation protein
MFDPFKDFETLGYLRNINRDKDPDLVKQMEHNLFRGNIDEALKNLEESEELTYENFLQTHKILFQKYYPWSGNDRAETMPKSTVKKGDVLFCAPSDCRRAIEAGLYLGQNPKKMSEKLGEVMGLFAYGHPFLDGNGRTMLLVHMELCHRAGFSVDWANTKKSDYLSALTHEIMSPGKGILDEYLLQFKRPAIERGKWVGGIFLINGLDGLDEQNQIDGDLADPLIAEKYKQYEKLRNYTYSSVGSDGNCEKCMAKPCICSNSGGSKIKPR